MAQVLAAGLAEVLRDHEDKISAAQAWCEQQNISSIHELKQKGDAAIDEFISAAGLEEFLHIFIVKRRIGDFAASAPAPKRKKPATARASRTLTIRTSCQRMANVCVGGDARLADEDVEACETCDFALPSVEHTGCCR